ncbi:MAG: HIT domain-containing protein [Myxococcota bacterium]|nr:HIT domain-containing protein [Myxococcota bacterium]
MSHDPQCIFCKIVREEAPAARVCEDEHALAFMDLMPVTPGHVLVIPKLHYANVFESDADSLAALTCLARRAAIALRRALEPDGMGVFQLNGAAAGQTVFHYHQHLIPRNQGDPLTLHGRKPADRDELEAMARRIADHL